MPDPLQQPRPDHGPLFGTSHAAGQKAAIGAGGWRAKILAHLERAPACLFEIAAAHEVAEHRISGRFTELAKDGYIEPDDNRVRRNPMTDCDCTVWRLRRDSIANRKSKIAILESYPLSIHLEHDVYDRQELLPNEGYPGIPYARRADNGGLRQEIRIELIECPGCGKPLFMRPAVPGGKPDFVCGSCGRVWKCKAVSEAGKSPLLALIMERIS